jgi:hypothetical protein
MLRRIKFQTIPETYSDITVLCNVKNDTYSNSKTYSAFINLANWNRLQRFLKILRKTLPIALWTVLLLGYILVLLYLMHIGGWF